MRISNRDIDRVYINSAVRDKTFTFNMPENHYHFYYELYYVKQSTCRFFINNTLYDLHAGDFIVVPPRELHYTRYLTDIPCIRINMYFKEQDLIDGIFIKNGDIDEKYLSGQIFHIPEMYQKNISELFAQMIAEDKIDDSSSRTMLRLQLKQLFLYCIRYCTFVQNALAQIYTKDEQILAAARYIAENYNKPLTLESISEVSGFSPTYFSKKFKSTTGIGVKEYIIYIRLKQAAMELISTNASITDIALNCGFSNSSYFKDVFKKMYEISPREFRKASNTVIPEH